MQTKTESTAQCCHIPRAAIVRKNLADAIKRVDLLRRLLKVAEYAERQSTNPTTALKPGLGGPK